MKKTLLTLALALAAGGAQAIPLSDLLAGGSITARDKLFDRWTLISYTTSDPNRVFDPAKIDVTALVDGDLDPGPGLRFATGSELSISGDGTYAFLDLMFGFRVTALDPNYRIKDNSLTLINAFYSWPGIGDGPVDAGSYILEFIGTGAGLDDLGVKDVQFSYAQGLGQVMKSRDRADFQPRSEVYVTKNLLVWATEVGEGAGMWVFEQRFSQTQVRVPEPATLGLLALGLVGLGLARLRKLA